MKRKRFGYTLIEISLFLAVTAVLFVGIIVATQGSIWNQRFFDTVQSYAEFWRSIYSQVANPQSVGKGNSETTAIYGKLIVFGEEYNLQGKPIDEGDKRNYGQQIFVYDVVGDAKGDGTGSATAMLAGLNANVVVVTQEEPKQWGPAGEATDYVPKWGAEIETTEPKQSFTGSILVVRHPRSGTINTLVSDEIIQVNDTIKEANEGNDGSITSLLTAPLLSGKFAPREVDFCVNPYGYGTETANRRDVRLAENARNGSGVEIIDLDTNTDDEERKNRCQN